MQIFGRSLFQDAPDSPEQGCPRLVGEDDDDRGRGQVGVVLDPLASGITSVRYGSVQGYFVAGDQIEGLFGHDLLAFFLFGAGQMHRFAALSGTWKVKLRNEY